MPNEMTREYPASPDPAGPHAVPADAFIPVVLIALSLISLLVWQLSIASAQRSVLLATIARQEETVRNSRKTQANLEKFARDLAEAAKTDSAARALVQKYGIQVDAAGGIPRLPSGAP